MINSNNLLDIDPDQNYCELNSGENLSYLTVDDFSKKHSLILNSHFSVLSYNIRSYYANSCYFFAMFSKVTDLCFSNDEIELCTVEVTLDSHQLFILGFYRPQSGNKHTFCDLVEEILQNNILRNKKILVLGDFNINMLDPDPLSTNFVNLLRSYHFFPIISEATRFSTVEGVDSSVGLQGLVWCCV